ncbi:MAG: helix-turn-helix domain-containing protein [Nanoarchaeota archaeon]
MWRLRLQLSAENQFLGEMALKHKVSMTGYPLTYLKKNKVIYLTSAGFLFGEESCKKALIRDLKKSPQCTNFEQEGDFIIATTKQPLSSEPVYNPQIIRPNPAIINKEGYHLWDLASFDRKPLEEVISFVEKHLKGKILSFKQEKIKNISFTKLLPELTDNQKKAMEMAINSGYYDYPKKITLAKLASRMKISYSTFQAHLKKAEGKIFPLILKEL